ncbi:hypothetical protein [Paremcibacter congregatus]|uniref:Uncharacterized protein n=1 Tax=Paremcibacter congregatus TaxID=2043170 RepID=A0A2G4YWN8_9PROT|nr:hypothetical protein [Paremcibacter congregatus]PHZ84029.1 hypothetical protein CRD36_13965 [Paremcibacter congregatus]PHZ84032.1 hypothetical protein CRD36_13980 [Paremcibacter congregatus]PHZ86757.1 hypothetical protein CRD36_00035 [Paremcibacter congregatus]QDE28965.1 hypothetical protein FIV45_17610 [Paremcibacter congregatus]
MVLKKTNQIKTLARFNFYDTTSENFLKNPLSGKWFSSLVYLGQVKDGKCFDCIIEPVGTELIKPGDTVECRTIMAGVKLKNEDVWPGQKLFLFFGPVVAEGEVTEVF